MGTEKLKIRPDSGGNLPGSFGTRCIGAFQAAPEDLLRRHGGDSRRRAALVRVSLSVFLSHPSAQLFASLPPSIRGVCLLPFCLRSFFDLSVDLLREKLP